MADPDLPLKVAAGHEDRVRPCVGASVCVDSIYASGSTPRARRCASTTRRPVRPLSVVMISTVLSKTVKLWVDQL